MDPTEDQLLRDYETASNNQRKDAHLNVQRHSLTPASQRQEHRAESSTSAHRHNHRTESSFNPLRNNHKPQSSSPLRNDHRAESSSSSNKPERTSSGLKDKVSRLQDFATKALTGFHGTNAISFQGSSTRHTFMRPSTMTNYWTEDEQDTVINDDKIYYPVLSDKAMRRPLNVKKLTERPHRVNDPNYTTPIITKEIKPAPPVIKTHRDGVKLRDPKQILRELEAKKRGIVAPSAPPPPPPRVQSTPIQPLDTMPDPIKGVLQSLTDSRLKLEKNKQPNIFMKKTPLSAPSTSKPLKVATKPAISKPVSTNTTPLKNAILKQRSESKKPSRVFEQATSSQPIKISSQEDLNSKANIKQKQKSSKTSTPIKVSENKQTTPTKIPSSSQEHPRVSGKSTPLERIVPEEPKEEVKLDLIESESYVFDKNDEVAVRTLQSLIQPPQVTEGPRPVLKIRTEGSTKLLAKLQTRKNEDIRSPSHPIRREPLSVEPLKSPVERNRSPSRSVSPVKRIKSSATSKPSVKPTRPSAPSKSPLSHGRSRSPVKPTTSSARSKSPVKSTTSSARSKSPVKPTRSSAPSKLPLSRGRSKSPVKPTKSSATSKSPVKSTRSSARSKSPVSRGRSRSPVKPSKRSRSSVSRGRSRSPVKHTRSPVKRSRSPVSRRSRSPVKPAKSSARSRSPISRGRSRSPVKPTKRSRSPVSRGRSKSPVKSHQPHHPERSRNLSSKPSPDKQVTSSTNPQVSSSSKTVDTKTHQATAPQNASDIEQYKILQIMFNKLATTTKHRGDGLLKTKAGVLDHLHALCSYILSFFFSDKLNRVSLRDSVNTWKSLFPFCDNLLRNLEANNMQELIPLCHRLMALIRFYIFGRLKTILPPQQPSREDAEGTKRYLEISSSLHREQIRASEYFRKSEEKMSFGGIAKNFPETFQDVCVRGDLSKGIILGNEAKALVGPSVPFEPYGKLNHAAIVGRVVIVEYTKKNNIKYTPIIKPEEFM